MIILITGASLTGKTLLAQRMLEEYKMPYVSIDHLLWKAVIFPLTGGKILMNSICNPSGLFALR